MLTNSRKKLIKSLSSKKNRDEYNLFTVEGEKSVNELINSSFNVTSLYYTAEALTDYTQNGIEITADDMQRISNFKSPSTVIAVAQIPKNNTNIEFNGLMLALDEIQDPGNLGTIIRIADWFGISSILCSENTVDVYGPKTIQAAMGAVTRVKINYLPLVSALKSARDKGVNILGTFLEGENIYNASLPPNGILVIGNEGKGISSEIENIIAHKLFIPYYPADVKSSESLNAAVATAIACSEFRRRMFTVKI